MVFVDGRLSVRTRADTHGATEWRHELGMALPALEGSEGGPVARWCRPACGTDQTRRDSTIQDQKSR